MFRLFCLPILLWLLQHPSSDASQSQHPCTRVPHTPNINQNLYKSII
ncbi:hypothetical protein NEISICOT_00301 [Neisseria sicca ATCC 29256]|uniref:Uncharacterized protein n=1 Tax=Neisseria sicca ATCC 29256 TaxID=547045 RepID=C6M1C1_NEISI|nr:hypothetical protein NEISICOT_00301 [Neisseria sicca ATCC 29256]